MANINLDINEDLWVECKGNELQPGVHSPEQSRAFNYANPQNVLIRATANMAAFFAPILRNVFEALLIQRGGTYHNGTENDPKCTYCAAGSGVFEQCITLGKETWHGACGNCHRNGGATRCSLAHRVEDDEKGGDDDDDSEDGDQPRAPPKAPTTTRSGRISRPTRQ